MNETVRIRGRVVPSLGRLTVRRRTYVLLEELSSGDRQSWKAFDPLSGPGGQYFLIRRLPLSTADRQLRVFQRLKVPTLPQVVEWQKHRDHIDVVITWFDGIPLTAALDHIRAGRRPAMAPAQVVRLISGLVTDVSHLHRRLQVVHGDVQPANLVLTDHPSRLHLIDFGSAWTTDWTTRRDEGDGHHRSYAAPELQNQDGHPTIFADQFSVAVIAFQLLTSQLPWKGLGGKAGRPEFVTQVSGKFVAPGELSTACQKLPANLRNSLDTLVTQCLSLAPQDRIATDQEWLQRWQELNLEFRRRPSSSRGAERLARFMDWLSGLGNSFKRSKQSDPL